MFYALRGLVLSAILLGTTAGAQAQQPGGTDSVTLPGERGVAPPYGPPITLAQAERAIVAARTEAARLKSGDIAIAVADTHGELGSPHFQCNNIR